MRVSELDEADYASLEQALQELRQSCLEPAGQACLVLGENNKLLAMAAFPLHYLTEGTITTYGTISEMLNQASRLAGSYTLPDRDRFRKLVRTELSRAENKCQVLQKEIAAAENAEEYRIKADNLMTYQYALQDHVDAEITVDDIYSETGEKISILLDQRISISQNVQAYYHKYDKFKRAQELLRVQLAQCREDIRYLASIETSLEASRSLAEIRDIRQELIAGGYLRESSKKKMAEKPSLPFKFTAPDGTVILVGKNNYQNDKLTFKTAYFNDLWFHTKDIPGSHVILRCGDDDPGDASILLAASLAAHFSQAAGSSKIPVDYTRCRFVKKPSGAKPGFVIFTNQTTLYITPDEEQLAPILQKDENA